MTNIPTRVQRKRTKGFKSPPNTRYCGRGTIYGNPFKVGEKAENGIFYHSNADVVALFGAELNIIITNLGMTEREYLEPLMKYDHLSCFCNIESACHVDIIIQRIKDLEKGEAG